MQSNNKVKNKINIAVLVSGGGTNLQALIDAQGTIITSGVIKLVISDNRAAYALKRAENAGIKTVCITKADFGGAAGMESELARVLVAEKIDLIVLAGFMRILSADFTKKFEKRIINIHPSLIPSFCGDGYYGIRVHEAVLEKGVKVTGATVHFVNEITDGGEIIMQKAVSVLDGDTPETLQKRVMRLAEWKILPKSVEKVSAELLNRVQT